MRRSPAARLRHLLGGGALTVVTLAAVVGLCSLPLFAVYQSTCGRGENRATRYSFVPPWDDPPDECRRHRSGFRIVKDAVGV